MAEVDLASLRTMSEEELAHTLEMSTAALSDFARTIAHNPNSTIEPRHVRSDAPARRALEGLGEQQNDRGIAAGLLVGATIGEGGMGVVRAAEQRSLGRTVAVKTLRPDAKSQQAILRLLREAWVTGALEHPNIVPVYDLGLDDDGAPIIVLKHIEGVEWAGVLHDPAALRDRFGASDPIEHNLKILLQLCNAVSLAHARGILHRDLKPENVMLGRFGEVYLVDWGIAVSLRGDPEGRLPNVAEATEMAGTPVYMAPEMLGASGKLSEQTDVYLLGAILYEILAGKPPHVGETFREIVESILRSTPSYPEHVPSELAAIATRAMSREPGDRFASAEELRQRLEWYLRHRGSLALSAVASERASEIREVIAGAEADSFQTARDRIYPLFGEARFGFRQAIAASDDNDSARAGLRELVGTVVEFELAHGTAEAAAAALAEIDRPAPELAARVTRALALREEEKKKFERLERLDADLDPSIGRRTRVSALIMISFLWIACPQIFGVLEQRMATPAPHWAPYVFTGAITGIGSLIVLWGRESLTKTMVNRRVLATAMLNFAAQLVLEVGCHLANVPFATTMALHLFLWFVCLAFLATIIERRIWPSVAVFAAAFFAVAAYPSLRWHAMSIASFSLLVNGTFAWGRIEEDPSFLVRRTRERIRRYSPGGRK